MIRPIGNSILCEPVELEIDNSGIDAKQFKDCQGWRVVEFGLNWNYRMPITKDDILIMLGDEEYQLILNGRRLYKFKPENINAIIKK